VTADEVYGGDARLRTCLEDHDLAYVLAVKATQPLWAAGEHGPAEVAARQLAAAVQAQVDGADGSAAGPGRVATATSGGRGGAAGGRGQAGTRMGAR
jgi:hypothetical protein